MRYDRQDGVEPDDLLIKLAAGIVVFAIAAWGFNEVRDAIDDRAQAASEASLANAQPVRDEVAPAGQPAARSLVPPTGAQLMRKCVGDGAVVFTSDLCPEGTRQVEIRSVPADHGRPVSREAAQERLETAQRDLERALARGQAQGWYPADAGSTLDSSRANCERVKAERDDAYRRRGNDRSFDFIRYWNDRVFEACKNS